MSGPGTPTNRRQQILSLLIDRPGSIQRGTIRR